MAILVLLFSLPVPSLAIDDGHVPTVTEAYAEVERVLESDETGVSRPADVAWDARARELVVSDALRPGRAIGLSASGAPRGPVTAAAANALDTASEMAADRVDLSAISADPETVAVAPGGNVFAYAPASATLWELDLSGTPVAQRDLSDAGLQDVTAMTVAPSADSTDDPAEQAIYIADAGTADG
ncbi:MAG: hypothetical protein ACRDFY_01740, partial [Candidatus Limnocylindria bacterium]